MKSTLANGQIGPGWNDIEMVRRKQHSVGRLQHRHRRVPGKQIHHHAFMGGVEMLDKDQGDAVAGAEAFHKLAAGFEATSRCADPDNREIIDAAGWAARCDRAPVRSTSRILCLRGSRWGICMPFKVRAATGA